MFSAYHRIGENRYQQRIGLDFEDFAIGQQFRHRPGVTLSQQDNADEALDTLNGAMLHYDAHYAAATAWQRPLMVSTLTLQRLIGMTSKTYGRRRAILGFDDITMNGPLFGGDTLYAESEILDLDAAGTVSTLLRGHKADGTEVARIKCRMAIDRREADAAEVQEERFAAYHMADDGALIEQVGLWFEDCVAGETFVHAPCRTFHREELLMHAWRSLDLTPQVHVPETFVVAVTTALTTRTFGRVVANLGWHDVQLPSAGFSRRYDRGGVRDHGNPRIPLTAGRGHHLGSHAGAQSAWRRGAVLSPHVAGVPPRRQRALFAGGILSALCRHRALLVRAANSSSFRIVAGDHPHALVQPCGDVAW